jgi:hypothetical protein
VPVAIGVNDEEILCCAERLEFLCALHGAAARSTRTMEYENEAGILQRLCGLIEMKAPVDAIDLQRIVDHPGLRRLGKKYSRQEEYSSH